MDPRPETLEHAHSTQVHLRALAYSAAKRGARAHQLTCQFAQQVHGEAAALDTELANLRSQRRPPDRARVSDRNSGAETHDGPGDGNPSADGHPGQSTLAKLARRCAWKAARLPDRDCRVVPAPNQG